MIMQTHARQLAQSPGDVHRVVYCYHMHAILSVKLLVTLESMQIHVMTGVKLPL